jgi:hypothetical protein
MEGRATFSPAAAGRRGRVGDPCPTILQQDVSLTKMAKLQVESHDSGDKG